MYDAPYDVKCFINPLLNEFSIEKIAIFSMEETKMKGIRE
jgi:hypothetical protein